MLFVKKIIECENVIFKTQKHKDAPFIFLNFCAVYVIQEKKSAKRYGYIHSFDFHVLSKSQILSKVCTKTHSNFYFIIE